MQPRQITQINLGFDNCRYSAEHHAIIVNYTMVLRQWNAMRLLMKDECHVNAVRAHIRIGGHFME